MIESAAQCLRPTVILKRVRDGGKLVPRLERDEISTFAESDDPCEKLVAYILALPQPSEASIRAAWAEESSNLDAIWSANARHLAPGEEILESVFESFGLSFCKTLDGPAIASQMESGPEEIRVALTEFVGRDLI